MGSQKRRGILAAISRPHLGVELGARDPRRLVAGAGSVEGGEVPVLGKDVELEQVVCRELAPVLQDRPVEGLEDPRGGNLVQ